MTAPDAVEAAAKVVDALRRRVRDYTGALDGSVVDQALEAAFTDVLADGVYVTDLLNAHAQQTLLDAVDAMNTDALYDAQIAGFLTARAATLTPKDTP